jgi:hypothetical protein
MTSKIVVNNIESDAGVSTVFFNSDIGGTGGTLNVDGNLNVDGVLSYEDVTNIDSVGLVTARNGLHVTSGDVAIGNANPDLKLHVNGVNALPSSWVFLMQHLGVLGYRHKMQITMQPTIHYF